MAYESLLMTFGFFLTVTLALLGFGARGFIDGLAEVGR
jgi:hypothetical protein